METGSPGGRIAGHGFSDLQSKRAKYNESKKNERNDEMLRYGKED